MERVMGEWGLRPGYVYWRFNRFSTTRTSPCLAGRKQGLAGVAAGKPFLGTTVGESITPHLLMLLKPSIPSTPLCKAHLLNGNSSNTADML